MKFLKILARRLLRCMDPDWELRAVNWFHFKNLGRKASELQWRTLKSAPLALYDAGAAQIGPKLFIFGGSLCMKGVSDKIFILDLETCRWSDGGTLLEGMPQSHWAIAADNTRFIYFASGQMGPDCRPPTTKSFVYDVLNKSWGKLPDLPCARYVPTAQLWNGRLHVVGGSKEDRNAPAHDHFSIAVDNGQAQENSWRQEPPIPRGGGDRASAVIDDHLYVFGGQEGDYIAIPGDPEYRCTPDLTTEIMYTDTYRLKSGSKEWERMADMPVKTSHTEFAVHVFDKKIILVGGQHDRIKRLTYLTDAIQAYDTTTDTWKVIGRLPYRTKTISAYHNGYLYFTTGQRDKGPDNAAAEDSYDPSLWRARFDLSAETV